MRSMRWLLSNGLGTKSTAPPRMAPTTPSTLGEAGHDHRRGGGVAAWRASGSSDMPLPSGR